LSYSFRLRVKVFEFDAAHDQWLDFSLHFHRERKERYS
jgi:hypothetical protein